MYFESMGVVVIFAQIYSRIIIIHAGESVNLDASGPIWRFVSCCRSLHSEILQVGHVALPGRTTA